MCVYCPQWCEIKNSAKFFFSALPGVTYNVFIGTLNPNQSIKPGVTTEYYYISYCRFLVFDAGNFCDFGSLCICGEVRSLNCG